MLNDTIAAISTSTIASGAISIVRMSGNESIEILKKIFSNKQDSYEGYRIYYGYIMDGDKKIDQVLVNVFRAPKSFTGEDMVEINCHGGLYITRAILTLCLANGARMALNGEFSKRAFLNGQIDLTQAEAINDIIKADNKDNALLAVNSLQGSISKLLNPLIDNVAQIIAHIEVNIDYPEYDDNGIITTEEILPMCEKWLRDCDEILSVAESSLVIKDGITVAIVGKPNVGKSSLLNALLKEDKAIVSEYAGTTRDLVEGDIHLKNVTLHLIDTAGIHQTDDFIENIGIKKSKDAFKKAQLVIVVLDGSRQLDNEDLQLLEETKDMDRLVVYNKNDIVKTDGEINISAINGEIDELVDAINKRFENDRIALSQPALTNERQISLMRQAKVSMENTKMALENDIPLDLVEEDLQNVFRCLKEILGTYAREDLLDEIFSRFCVGK